MSANPLAVAARRSLRVLFWQITGIVVLAALCLLIWGSKVAWSVLTGGGIGLVWTVYMALTLTRHSVDYGARMSPVSFFAGWFLKIALTASLLVVAFRSPSLEPVAVLGGLFGAMVAYWAALVLDRQVPDKP